MVMNINKLWGDTVVRRQYTLKRGSKMRARIDVANCDDLGCGFVASATTSSQHIPLTTMRGRTYFYREIHCAWNKVCIEKLCNQFGAIKSNVDIC
jgi:hypothetical protein